MSELSQLDQFAAHALNGMLSADGINPDEPLPHAVERLTDAAYRFAAAMVELSDENALENGGKR